MNVKKLALPLSLVLAAAGLAGAVGSTSSTSSTSTLAQRQPMNPPSTNPAGRPGQPGGPNGAGPRAPITAQGLTTLIQNLSAKTTDPDARRLLTESRALAAKGSQDPKYLRAAFDLLRAAATLSGQDLGMGMGRGGHGRGPGGPGLPGGQPAPGAPTSPTPPAGS